MPEKGNISGISGFLKTRLFLGPFLPAVIFYLCGLAVFFFFRWVLALRYSALVMPADDFMNIFYLGFRLDTITLIYFNEWLV